MMGCSGCNDTGGASYKGHYVNRPAPWSASSCTQNTLAWRVPPTAFSRLAKGP